MDNDDNVVSIRFLPYYGGKPARCLKCGSKDVIPIVYGLPDEESIALAKREIIECGWDVRFGGEPAWRCKSCREAFGSDEERRRRFFPPPTPYNEEDLRELWPTDDDEKT